MSVSKVEIDQGAEVMKCVLNAGLQGGLDPLTKVLDAIKKLGGKAMPVIGFVLEVVDFVWPDNSKHEQIMDAFKKLTNEIDHIRRDIQELEKMIEWESAKQQYSIAVTDLKVGIEYVYGMVTSKGNPARYKEWKDRLITYGANPALTRAINLLATGLSGGADLQADILQRFYNVSRGYRAKLITLSSRLVSFLCGGLITLMVYEILVRGLPAAKDLMTKLYTHKLTAVHAYVNKMVAKTLTEYKTNLQLDLEKGIADNASKPNRDIASTLSKYVFEKYDWLKLHVIIYNDMTTDEYHCIGGPDRVTKLHYHKKCGIIYYRNKNARIENHQRASEVLERATSVGDSYRHAGAGFRNMEKYMKEKNIWWYGLALIAREYDFRLVNNDKRGLVLKNGYYFTVITILK